MYNSDLKLASLNASLESVYEAMKTPSQEGIMTTLREFIPNMINDFIGFVKGLTNTKDPIQLTSAQKDLLKILNEVKYVDLRHLTAYCPEGFKGKFVDYLDILKPAVALVLESESYLDNFNRVIGNMISNKQGISMTNYNATFKKLNEDITTHIKAVSKFFPNGNKDKGVVGDFIGNNNEFKEVFVGLNALNNTINQVNRSQVIKKTKIASDYLIELKRKLQEDDISNASSIVPTQIAEATLAIGNLLSLFSNLYYALLSMTGCVDDTIKGIDKAYR